MKIFFFLCNVNNTVFEFENDTCVKYKRIKEVLIYYDHEWYFENKKCLIGRHFFQISAPPIFFCFFMSLSVCLFTCLSHQKKYFLFVDDGCSPQFLVLVASCNSSRALALGTNHSFICLWGFCKAKLLLNLLVLYWLNQGFTFLYFGLNF